MSWGRKQILPRAYPAFRTAYADSAPSKTDMDVLLSLTVLAIVGLTSLGVFTTLELTPPVDLSHLRVLHSRILMCVQPLLTACRPAVAVVRRLVVRFVQKRALSLQHSIAEGHCDALLTTFLCCFADLLARVSHLALEDVLFTFLVGQCLVGWWWR